MNNPRRSYEKRLFKYGSILNSLEKTAKLLGNLRLFSFLSGLGLAAPLYKSDYMLLSIGALLAGIFIYILLIIRHNRINKKIQYTNSLLRINSTSLKRLDEQWKDFPDTGEDFYEEEHPYSGDLDLFGRGSLFQWISTAVTHSGRRKLRDLLAEPPANQGIICNRQHAIRELAGMLTWRQKFSAAGMEVRELPGGPEPLIKWAGNENEFYRRPVLIKIFRILPIFTISVIVLYLAFLPVLKYFVVALVILQALLIRQNGKERSKILQTVQRYENSIKNYYKMLRHFERGHFTSELLTDMQKSLFDQNKRCAFQQLEKLSKLTDAISNRNNAVFIIINILTLWDYQCMIALEKWKLESGRFLEHWLNTLGELEAFCSLAIVNFDNGDWPMPTFIDGPPGFKAEDLGHPLLGSKRVRNDLTVAPPSGILLITGSNMSGKSTLLRTAGINLVLAYAGAPVCARSFNCSVMTIYTCMRVSDNLEKSISSFYAELLRIKKIVEASEKTQLFFLMDEIFKGTNSQDRNTGAKVLIKQLLKAGAVGLVSTHDLELSELEKETCGKIKNYHFREYYQEGKIHFDYMLRSGISTTRNALYLIKMAGIETD